MRTLRAILLPTPQNPAQLLIFLILSLSKDEE